MIRQDANVARHAVPLGTRGLRACHRVIATFVTRAAGTVDQPGCYILISFCFSLLRSGQARAFHTARTTRKPLPARNRPKLITLNCNLESTSDCSLSELWNDYLKLFSFLNKIIYACSWACSFTTSPVDAGLAEARQRWSSVELRIGEPAAGEGPEDAAGACCYDGLVRIRLRRWRSCEQLRQWEWRSLQLLSGAEQPQQ